MLKSFSACTYLCQSMGKRKSFFEGENFIVSLVLQVTLFTKVYINKKNYFLFKIVNLCKLICSATFLSVKYLLKSHKY